MQYSEVRNYDLNVIIKDYANFPRFLPLPCHMEHGWSPHSFAAQCDLVTDKPLMMVVSKRRKIDWQKSSNIPVTIMGLPFIHYKNAHCITQKFDAKGTVVFPSHSTYYIKSKFHLKAYCRELKKLPAKFQPITICLFWLDYIDVTTNIYREMGFEVVTAGYKITNSLEFVKNFYDILSSHKYATSNDIGSYIFYAVDLKIPFFLSGKPPLLVNKGLRDVTMDEFSFTNDFEWGEKVINMFSTGPITTISRSQEKFVIKETGIKDCLPPKKMRALLWKYYNKNHYWLTAFIPYLIASLLAKILFNGPWIKHLISLRKKMTD